MEQSTSDRTALVVTCRGVVSFEQDSATGGPDLAVRILVDSGHVILVDSGHVTLVDSSRVLPEITTMTSHDAANHTKQSMCPHQLCVRS